MLIRQTQISFSAFASSASSATATQSPESQVPKQSKQGSTSQSFQQPSLALHVADGSADCTPPVSAVHPAALVVAHGVDGGECTGPCVNEWSAAQWSRRIARQRAVSAARSVPRWGVECDGVVRLFYSRARAFNLARSSAYYRFVGACE